MLDHLTRHHFCACGSEALVLTRTTGNVVSPWDHDELCEFTGTKGRLYESMGNHGKFCEFLGTTESFVSPDFLVPCNILAPWV